VKRLLAWALTLVSGVPPDDLSPSTLRTLERIFLAVCALATAVVFFIVVRGLSR
jgi:hypothetical protein